jgi:hypothetical protein
MTKHDGRVRNGQHAHSRLAYRLVESIGIAANHTLAGALQ